MIKDILVIGSSNIDLIMKMNRLPEKGETITDCSFLQTFGGKGANQAVAAARSGGIVTFLSSVGDDDFGTSMISNYKKDNINTDFVFKAEDVSSGTALIMIGGDGNNYISVAPGANYELKSQHIDGIMEIMARFGIIVLQYEILTETLEYILSKAMEIGVKTLLNFAPAKHLNPSSLSKVSILVVNETETQFLTGIPVVSPDNAPEAASTLRSKGIETIIITLGINGSYVLSRNYTGFIPAYKVDAVDATAAGDVYCGSLATALMEDKPLQEAVKFSSAAAALCVTKLGAQRAAPHRKEIDDFVNLNAI
jgi:ribokinase